MMNESTFSPFLTGWLIANLVFLAILWSFLPNKSTSTEQPTFRIKKVFSVFQDQLHPYHHVLEQLEWISDFSHNESDLSIVKSPKIFYDRRLLYHVTESHGCRYKCEYPNYFQDFGVGDIAVFSEPFYTMDAEYLKQHGALIAFESVESPVHMRELTQIQMEQVDMFITYMPWSQVPYMYPVFLRKTNRGKRFTRSEITAIVAKNSTHLLPSNHKKRERLIAWLVSNGSPNNNRDIIALSISALIPVDIYGGVGKETPPGRDPLQWISEHYKFYLAFENSNCRYYITEKVTSNALRYGMVPIVLGAYKEDYESILPPHSYINLDDFKSITELAEYLLYLDRNDTAYAEYFAWKEYGDIYVSL
ncbi:Glycoprotein 3-alpha-L-fucosyltransferase A [Taenia solium]|eukprot:TsM_000173400 transcript=TsM_000173400 gene=TsM_000173400